MPDKKDKNNNPEQLLPEEFVLSSDEYKALKEKADLADQHFDKFIRLQADVENMRKRSLKEKENFVKFASMGLINEFINILDEFELAKESAEKKHDAKLLFEGVNMITKHLQDILKNQGLTVISQTGVAFDHDRHEAVETAVLDDCDENTVVEVLRKGYSLNGRVIRPAMVKVSRKPLAA
ncbi:MAG: nucleotide exchange factor GrpE [Candidatus Omnitrophica bacterium CG12_big_fil_rev_8_21_14_0_65_43_15]|uniref:Protein GrpE n=1 Tax=Candidatus Taenaricola geysiri TaxID=1974752 RepID=A0A2J0LD52_9BACT|nr:MAG: nucleotide exchange factor GrpE [Candidatus Omnitrophica bacterium CG1_02_43_210]PIR66210.1 MAG: nucleotide exchange factor GrpE [Candidatus Omnitrophica bacterium CG10_big_fil_rev_8_21_14_0_10_43_8]PIV11940.1 MAG: nucleotide exchange factor GrpE [Candidatus Omnitrophica bacterium CG03_land_8_20_14_0_80_43_22]PIW65798.1 MAG: nucleotide exchange factor GrpE [Candidatus Omnitrophica bacterium CG12_big_fil_rev_8_21_14_0_65_43_15]PIW80021.1 MAG: nucleotide exchange factor GrpE [Candidatus O